MQQLYDYDAIVQEALTSPGKIHERYSALHEFSLGNQWLALMQLDRPEPVATYLRWQNVQRQVRKGSKAIELIMPVMVKAKNEITAQDDDGKRTIFLPKRNWFPLSATDGEPYSPPPIPNFDLELCLATLNIKQEPFQSLSGNCMGYAKTAERTIAISPLTFDSLKTGAHEISHVILHADLFSAHEPDRLTKDIRECEAELCAYIVKATLGSLTNLEFARGYIQSYIGDSTLGKVRLPKVFAAADSILRAGRPVNLVSVSDTPRLSA